MFKLNTDQPAFKIIVVALAVIVIAAVCLLSINRDGGQPAASPAVSTTPSSPAETTPEETNAPTPEPTPELTEAPTPEPTPIPEPTPTYAPVPLDQTSTAAREWSFGYWAHKKDENGIEQLVYELEPELVSVTAKYQAITGHQTGRKTVYLTFDEGYENGYTPVLLDVLREKNVQAAFFLTGDFVETCPHLVKRMAEEGHILGNHTEHHPRMADLSEDKFKAELTTVQDRVDQALGYHYAIKYYRPPQGYFSERDLALARSMGYRTVFWSYAYDDYSKPNDSSEELIRKGYLQTIQSIHDGEVLLLHAVSKVNSQILGDVIDYYRGQGYTFASLDDY